MISYYGGKAQQADKIIQLFPADYTKRVYVEVFGGDGWVLFKKQRSILEVYNDINSDLVNLFRVLRDKFEVFRERAQWVLYSREMHKEACEKYQKQDFKDDIDRALITAIIITQSYIPVPQPTGWVHNKTVSVRAGSWYPFFSRIKKIKERLINVQIENLDWQECINIYDSSNVLFYLDPPYLDLESQYKVAGWSKKEHIRLAERLRQTKGLWALSYYDHPLIRELYKDYHIFEFIRTVGTGKHNTKPRKVELLITNYKPPHKTSFL